MSCFWGGCDCTRDYGIGVAMSACRVLYAFPPSEFFENESFFLKSGRIPFSPSAIFPNITIDPMISPFQIRKNLIQSLFLLVKSQKNISWKIPLNHNFWYVCWLNITSPSYSPFWLVFSSIPRISQSPPLQWTRRWTPSVWCSKGWGGGREFCWEHGNFNGDHDDNLMELGVGGLASDHFWPVKVPYFVRSRKASDSVATQHVAPFAWTHSQTIAGLVQ